MHDPVREAWAKHEQLGRSGQALLDQAVALASKVLDREALDQLDTESAVTHLRWEAEDLDMFAGMASDTLGKAAGQRRELIEVFNKQKNETP